jgi:hypothetical protein
MGRLVYNHKERIVAGHVDVDEVQSVLTVG